MIVLGFDTATPSTAVGLMLADGSIVEARDDPPAGGRPGHSTRLLGLARELLEQERLCWGDIERISVGVGPGTFTGLRIGVATARGLAQSLAVDAIGVSSLRALAHPLSDRSEKVLAAIDARRGEAFVAAYQIGQELLGARALPPERLAEALELVEANESAGVTKPSEPAGVTKPSVPAGGAAPSEPRHRWIAVGDGALRFAEMLRGIGVEIPPPDSPLHAVRARAVCELGARSARQESALLPDYGRPPDAEVIALQGAGG